MMLDAIINDKINQNNLNIHNLKDENTINENPKFKEKPFLNLNEPEEIKFQFQ